MDFLRIWFCFCLLFCAYCLSILWLNDQYEVTYYLDESVKSEHEQFKYFGCLSFESFRFNRTEIEMDELRKLFTNSLKEMLSHSDKQPANGFNESILNRSESEDLVVVIRENICAILFNQSELTQFYLLTSPQAVMFAYKADTFNWIRMNEYDQKFGQLIVLNKPYPYSNCAAKGERRFSCLHECFKRRFRLSEYFYFANDSGPIQLNHFGKNKTIRAQEDDCFEECSRSNCKLVYLYPNDSEEKEKVQTFRARPMLSKFDFNVQMAGLVCLIFNFFLSRLASIAIEFISSKLSNRRIRDCLFYLRLFVLFVLLLGCTCMFGCMILAYKERVTNATRKETTRNLLRPETIHLVVCVPVEFCVPGNFEHSMTMLQLEKATDRLLNQTIDSIVLDYQDKPLKWVLTPKVLFVKLGEPGSLQRCFQLEIDPIEPRYQMLLSISKLKVRFKDSAAHQLFLLAENENSILENFNLKSFHYSGSNTFRKRVEKRSRLSGNCIDYEQAYSRLKCTTRQNCIEKCVQGALFHLYLNVTTGTDDFRLVIDRNQFSKSEWESAHLDAKRDAGEVTIARNWCMKKFRDQKPCVGTLFEESVRINQPDENAVEMELYYEVVGSVEEEPDVYKLLLDILSVQSIFFGLTGFKLVKTIGEFMRAKLRLRDRTRILSQIQLLCLAGLAWHSYHILDRTINQSLIYSQHYEIAQVVEMPELIFCLAIPNVSTISKRPLTGNYLQELTSEMNAENIFKSIAYLDNKNQWIELKKFRSCRFEMETFFFLFKKCFSLKFNMSYTLKQFYFLDSGEVLQVAFNKEFFRDRQTIHFLTHRTNTMQFSKILKIRTFASTDALGDYHYYVSQELFLHRHFDRLYFIKNLFKNPLALFGSHDDVDDANGYLSRLSRGFKEAHKKVTLNLPIRKELFDLEIDENAFDHYFSDNYEQDERKPFSSIYQREFAINYYHRKNKSLDMRKESDDKKGDKKGGRNRAEPDFSFSLIHFKKVIVATSDDTYPKLVLNLLNGLSFWLKIPLLKVPLYLLAFKRSLPLLYGSLRKVWNFLSVSQ